MRAAYLLLGFCACGQLEQARFSTGTGEVMGRAVDERGEGVAAVTLYRSGTKDLVARTLTSPDGTFRLTKVDVGTVKISLFDSTGRVGIAEAIVVGDAVTRVGDIVVRSEFDPESLLPDLRLERRMTSGPEVGAVHLSASGGTVLFRGGELWFRGVPDAMGAWSELEEVPVPEIEVSGITDRYMYGPGRDVTRQPISGGRAETLFLPGDAFGVAYGGVGLVDGWLFQSSVPGNSFLEDFMPGDLFHWPDGSELAQWTHHAPDGMTQLIATPGKDRVAYAEQPYDGGPRVFLVEWNVEAMTPDRQAVDPVAALDYSSDGRLYSIHIGATTYLQIQSGPRIEISQQPMQRVDVFRYRPEQQIWMLGGKDQNGGAVCYWVDDTATLATDCAGPVGAVRSHGDVEVFESKSEGFDQLFASKEEMRVALTFLAADHRLIGIYAEGQRVLYLARDPITGVQQIFSAPIWIPENGK